MPHRRSLSTPPESVPSDRPIRLSSQLARSTGLSAPRRRLARPIDYPGPPGPRTHRPGSPRLPMTDRRSPVRTDNPVLYESTRLLTDYPVHYPPLPAGPTSHVATHHPEPCQLDMTHHLLTARRYSTPHVRTEPHQPKHADYPGRACTSSLSAQAYPTIPATSSLVRPARLCFSSLAKPSPARHVTPGPTYSSHTDQTPLLTSRHIATSRRAYPSPSAPGLTRATSHSVTLRNNPLRLFRPGPHEPTRPASRRRAEPNLVLSSLTKPTPHRMS